MSNPVVVPTLSVTDLDGARLVEALQHFSCVFITDLGPLADHLEATLATAREFFDLDDGQKAAVRWTGDGPWQGWQPVHADGPMASLLERFEVALPDPSSFLDPADWTDTFGLWPETPRSFAAAWGGYYAAVRELTCHLVTLIAEALGLPDNELPAWTSGQHSNLCVNHYLVQDEAPAPGRVRALPHADIGGITLLWADQNGGLQARIGPDESWVQVDFPPGALLLQAGDLLHLWSGGSIPANLHRVVNPERSPAIAQTDRYSVVFFHHPDLDAHVTPVGSDGPGVEAREHVLARQRASYGS